MCGYQLDIEFLIMRSSVIIHSFTHGTPIFTLEDRILFSGFISAIDIVAKAALNANIDMIKLANAKIYFYRDNQFLYILLVADYEILEYPKEFFSYIIQDLKQLDIAHINAFTKEMTKKMNLIISTYLSHFLELA